MASISLPEGFTEVEALYRNAYRGSSSRSPMSGTDNVKMTISVSEIIGKGTSSIVTFHLSGSSEARLSVAEDGRNLLISKSGENREINIKENIRNKLTYDIRFSENVIKIGSSSYSVKLDDFSPDIRAFSFYPNGFSFAKYVIYDFETYNADSSNKVVFYLDTRGICGIANGNGFGYIGTDTHFTVWDELTEKMVQRGNEKMQEHIMLQSFDGTIITGGMQYTYGKDFNIGDYVTVYSKKLNKYFNLQITSVTKSISNGVEMLDIAFGKDLLSVNKLEGR